MQKKASLLVLYEILKIHSDENHKLRRKDIERIMLNEYDLKLDRKTIHDHIEMLNQFGCDIQTPLSSTDGYYLGQRIFESSEIHLLCNAVYASHFIPEKASEDLIMKLLNTQSKFIKNDVHQTVYMKNLNKTVNKEFFLNIELLNEAIQLNHPITFDYMKYDLHKKLIKRKDHKYKIHPYYIVYGNENYYLICRNDEYQNLSHYRIDKMQNITILTDEIRKPLEKSFNPYVYTKTKIYMFGGNEERITLKCDYRILDDIVDRFGSNVFLQPYDETHFLAIVQASKQGIIYLCLQYLQYCEVTAPSSLRNEIKELLEDSLCAYTAKE